MRLPQAPLPPRVRETLSRRRAGQLNLYKALANSPQSAEAWLDFLWSIRDDFTTPRALRELLILEIAHREASAYERHHHLAMALAAGVPEAKVAAVADGSGGWPTDLFDEGERLALALAGAVADGHVSDDLAEAVIAHFGVGAYVELALTASAYVMGARVLDALGVVIEEPDDASSDDERPDALSR